jgi:hypothetical protein
MELHMNKTLAVLTSGAINGLALTAGYAAETPLPPRVDFVATPAGQLHLGMTADDVIRIMGEPATETDFAIGSTQIRKLEFAGPIPVQIIVSDEKLSRVTLDPFRVEEAALPSFIRGAWPGFASCAVRRSLGEPAVVRRHSFFGIEVEQWIYSRPGEADASVFFRADRVIATSAGRGIPANLFRIDLPSPPQAESDDPMLTPRLGMTAHEIEKSYGALSFRVDYVRNGQPSSREIYEVGSKRCFVAFTFVDGVMTEFETWGPMGDDASFQGL